MSGRHLGCGVVGNYCPGGSYGCGGDGEGGSWGCGPPGGIVIRPCAEGNYSCLPGNEMACAIASISGKCCTRKTVVSRPPVKLIQITFKCPTSCTPCPVLMDPCCPPPVAPPTCPTPRAPGSCCGTSKCYGCQGR